MYRALRLVALAGGMGLGGVAAQDNTVTTFVSAATVTDLEQSFTTPTVTAYDGSCSPNSANKLSVVVPDTPDAFLANEDFSSLAYNASIPDGYTESFVNIHAAVSMNTYLRVAIMDDNYNVDNCAKLCDETKGCLGFNIFIKRTPYVSPSDECPQPASVPQVQCTIWGSQVTATAATNTGEHMPPSDDSTNFFHVVIAASNGYSKRAGPDALPGFTGPQALEGAINATEYTDPLTNQTVDLFVANDLFEQAFDPAVCAEYCLNTTAANMDAVTKEATELDKTSLFSPCNFFNAYILSMDNVPQGTFCSLYTRPIEPSLATFTGGIANGHTYAVSHSYSYTLIPQEDGIVHGAASADKDQ